MLHGFKVSNRSKKIAREVRDKNYLKKYIQVEYFLI
jgi:hypothetical protein